MDVSVNRRPPQSPIGRCIYCGTTRGRLTREHVVPRSLGGNYTLQKASCDPCAEITKKLEGYVGRRVFGDLRLQHGFRMKEKPSHLPVYEDVDGDPVLVPADRHPGFILMFVNEPPGILTGRAKGTEFKGEQIFRPVTPDFKARTESLKAAGFPTVLQRHIEIDRIGRFYAKVGLGLIAAACGMDGFWNELGAVVRGVDSKWDHWVGGTTQEMSQMPEPGHRNPILHRAIVYAVPVGQSFYAAVELQMLAYFGMPNFTVIGGQLTEAGLNKINSLK